ncbi:hypothetical protein EBH_0041120 [Eimeria brunetti]|uniref:SAG family member n=1 Tax=Eimeria brunetti TaxID=51314 RepID=U6LAR0_9EIME|nr:hypothetical protein EBH_0041120 [Eimeria brunetti]
MSSFYKTAAAVCLVALSGLQSAVADDNTYKFVAEEVTEADAYFAANLARNGKLPVQISAVARDDELIAALKKKVESKPQHTGQACEATHITSNLETIFHHAFDYKTGTTPDYLALLQNAIDSGLTVFNLVPAEERDTGLDGASREVARGNAENQTEKAVLFCELSPAVTSDKTPFDEEYFTGLASRTAQLSEMTEDDLKAPTNDGTAATAVPTVLAAGLVAMLTAVLV